jgi:hypothetical protein
MTKRARYRKQSNHAITEVQSSHLLLSCPCVMLTNPTNLFNPSNPTSYSHKTELPLQSIPSPSTHLVLITSPKLHPLYSLSLSCSHSPRSPGRESRRVIYSIPLSLLRPHSLKNSGLFHFLKKRVEDSAYLTSVDFPGSLETLEISQRRELEFELSHPCQLALFSFEKTQRPELKLKPFRFH